MTWLLCDYGEVLCLPQPAASKAAIEQAAGCPVDRLWPAYWEHRAAYDRGDLSAADYWSLVLGSPPAAPRLRELVELDLASWLHPDRASLEAAARAAERGLRLAILSNAPVEVADAIDRQGWLAGFDPRLFSCRLRTVKPERAIYERVVGLLDAIVFLDDRPANVAAALAAGLRAEVFTGAAQIDAVALA